MFKSFRFSSNALFSFDPPPFSMVQPFASDGREKQPLFTLKEYPLPDGSWCWLSGEWMIDMRDGNVQHDGFEYNWAFGGKKWRSRAGRFYTGALVRRRRWARLMVRPAAGLQSSVNDQNVDSGVKEGRHESLPVGVPTALDDVWKGDGEDWRRCHEAIRSQDSDGRKLELWEDWIERPIDISKIQRKQWTDDAEWLPSEVARDEHFKNRQAERKESPQAGAISTVLRQHVRDSVEILLCCLFTYIGQRQGIEILYTFIYPSTRTRFMQLLARSGLIPELPSDELANSLQFWDRIQEFSPKVVV